MSSTRKQQPAEEKNSHKKEVSQMSDRRDNKKGPPTAPKPRLTPPAEKVEKSSAVPLTSTEDAQGALSDTSPAQPGTTQLSDVTTTTKGLGGNIPLPGTNIQTNPNAVQPSTTQPDPPSEVTRTSSNSHGQTGNGQNGKVTLTSTRKVEEKPEGETEKDKPRLPSPAEKVEEISAVPLTNTEGTQGALSDPQTSPAQSGTTQLSEGTTTTKLSEVTATTKLSEVTATTKLSEVTATTKLSEVTTTTELSEVTTTNGSSEEQMRKGLGGNSTVTDTNIQANPNAVQPGTTQPDPPSEVTRTSLNSHDRMGNGQHGKVTLTSMRKVEEKPGGETEKDKPGGSSQPLSGMTGPPKPDKPPPAPPKPTAPPRSKKQKQKPEPVWDCTPPPPTKRMARFRALVLSWEVSCDTIDVIGHLTKDSKINDCTYAALFPSTKEKWVSQVDQSSIVIMYSSPSSQRPLYQLDRYLEYCISKKGQEKVIVVIGDADKLAPEWRTKLEKNPYCKSLEQILVSRAELDWIKEAEVVGIMDQLKYSLIGQSGPQGNPAGNGELNQSAHIEQKGGAKIKAKKKQIVNKMETKGKSLPVIRQTVGFVTWSAETCGEWLRELLKSRYFLDIKYIDVTKTDIERVAEEISSVPSLILFLAKESLATPLDVTFLSSSDKAKMIGVIDDLDVTNWKETVELFNKSDVKKLAKDLFMFRKEDKEIFLRWDQQAGEKIKQKWKQVQAVVDERVILLDPPVRKFGIVNIFSRSSKSDYTWLSKLLTNPKLPGSVDDVRPLYISNNGYLEFYEAVNSCTFGILYHTKNRGRINITDVTDSLYDFEIEYLSTALGRGNVLVIIDDLQDNSSKEKRRILSTQPKIREYARNLFLVTENMKTDEEKLLKALADILHCPMIEEAEEDEEEEEEEEDEEDEEEKLVNGNPPTTGSSTDENHTPPNKNSPTTGPKINPITDKNNAPPRNKSPSTDPKANSADKNNAPPSNKSTFTGAKTNSNTGESTTPPGKMTLTLGSETTSSNDEDKTPSRKKSLTTSPKANSTTDKNNTPPKNKSPLADPKASGTNKDNTLPSDKTPPTGAKTNSIHDASAPLSSKEDPKSTGQNVGKPVGEKYSTLTPKSPAGSVTCGSQSPELLTTENNTPPANETPPKNAETKSSPDAPSPLSRNEDPETKPTRQTVQNVEQSTGL